MACGGVKPRFGLKGLLAGLMYKRQLSWAFMKGWCWCWCRLVIGTCTRGTIGCGVFSQASQRIVAKAAERSPESLYPEHVQSLELFHCVTCFAVGTQFDFRAIDTMGLVRSLHPGWVSAGMLFRGNSEKAGNM